MNCFTELRPVNKISIMTTIRETQGTTTMQGKFDLIKGEYTPEEALEIVTHVLLKKINFHEMRGLSQQIRFGLKDEASLQRIKELKASLEAFQELAKEAKLSGKSVRLKSSISVELI